MSWQIILVGSIHSLVRIISFILVIVANKSHNQEIKKIKIMRGGREKNVMNDFRKEITKYRIDTIAQENTSKIVIFSKFTAGKASK